MSTSELTPEEKMAAEIGELIDEQIDEERPSEDTVSAVEAQSDERVVVGEERTRTRLLIYTTNPHIFTDDSAIQQKIVDYGYLFAEVHVMLLNTVAKGLHKNQRLAENVWLYAANAKHEMSAYREGLRLADKEMVFANGFRADIIITFDPFLAGRVAKKVSEKYQRPLQLRLFTNIFDSVWQEQQSHWWLKSRMMDSFFESGPSVRVANRTIEKLLLETYPGMTERVKIIPSYLNLDSIKNFESTGELKARYPQYSAFILFAGPLTDNSGVLEAMAASAQMMRYPVAFLALGEGPAKQELENRATALGIAEKLIVSPPGVSLEAALSEAQMLVFPGGFEADETIVIKAAVAGLPIVAGATEMVKELFVHDESAYICEEKDVLCMSKAVHDFVNNNALRRRLSRLAKEDIFDQVEQDPEKYKEILRYSIEEVLRDYETPAPEEEVIEEQEYPERQTS